MFALELGRKRWRPTDDLERVLREEEPLELEEDWATRVETKHLRRLAGYLLARRALLTRALGYNLAFTATALAVPYMVKLAVDEYVAEGEVTGLWIASGVLVALAFAAWQLQRLTTVWSARLGQTVLNDLRTQIFGHIQQLSMSFFDRTKTGRIIARADSDVMGLENLLTWGAGQILTSMLTILGALVLMATFSWKLTLAIAVLLLPIFWATKWFRRAVLPLWREVRASYSRITANLAENITGVRVVQSFTREEVNLQRFNRLLEHHYHNILRAQSVWSLYWPFLTLLSGLGNITILLFGTWLMARGELQAGEMIAFVLYLQMFFGPINLMGEVYNELLSASASCERIFGLLDTKPEVVDRPAAVDAPALRGEIEFDRVFFRYQAPRATDSIKQQTFADDAEKPWILNDVSFSVRPGEVCALVGHTGSGKSTIANLIARFYEAQEGVVRIDGRDVRDYTLHSLHRQMAIVLQQVFLFRGTVLENIRYGRPDATEEDVRACAKALGSLDAIERLPKGFETEVQERGQGMSQGERQLISFTRAMLANPRILILDEATSAVDTHTEAAIQAALERLLEGRTAIVVAHRLSTIRRANQVLVIEKGRIVERGSHGELIALDGRYAALYREFLGLGEGDPLR